MHRYLGRGRCGGHITLLFTVSDESDDPIRQGSLGAGLCVDDGVEVVAYGEDGEFGLSVTFETMKGDSELYEAVLDVLAGEVPGISDISWGVSVTISLPPAQGFGVSASGAVASAMAFQRAIGLPYEESLRRAFSVAHKVERSRSTGLGDVTALAAGGVERRLVAGSPYHGPDLQNGPGQAEGWSLSTPLILAWRQGAGKHTSVYIDDSEWKRVISDAGSRQMETLSRGKWGPQRWSNLIESADAFSHDSGLIDDSSRNELMTMAETAVANAGRAEEVEVMLCMLGESVAIVPADPADQGEWVESVIAELEGAGLKGLGTTVSGLS